MANEITMWDSIDVSTILKKDKPQAVAGYTGGHWPTFNDLVKKFPNAHHLSIAVQASDSGRCLDVEQGDATNDEAADWFHNHADHSNGKPVFYTSASNAADLIHSLAAAGIDRQQYFLWTANYRDPRKAEIDGPNTTGYPQADGTQWDDGQTVNRNVDISLIYDYVFGPPPPPPDPNHYLWFYTGIKVFGKVLNERALVKAYDKYRVEQTPKKHPHRAQLAAIRGQLKILAGYVWTVAHLQRVHGKPSWTVNHRGWRFQQLVKRSQGERLV